MDIKQAHTKVLKDTEKLFKAVQKEQLKRLKRRTPVDTGTARDGWKIDDEDIINDVDYVKYLEYGTANTPPIGMARITALETPSIVAEEARKIK